ncbi:uncharacterized protein VTP21DRAFT_4441 [Calcarisporiella thermophila]|uniref:uncharacterized protein n=1 Tax=Calcarisporiella thermophila TaxID=911321 RepID=UPI0037434E2D
MAGVRIQLNQGTVNFNSGIFAPFLALGNIRQHLQTLASSLPADLRPLIAKEMWVYSARWMPQTTNFWDPWALHHTSRNQYRFLSSEDDFGRREYREVLQRSGFWFHVVLEKLLHRAVLFVSNLRLSGAAHANSKKPGIPRIVELARLTGQGS